MRYYDILLGFGFYFIIGVSAHPHWSSVPPAKPIISTENHYEITCPENITHSPYVKPKVIRSANQNGGAKNWPKNMDPNGLLTVTPKSQAFFAFDIPQSDKYVYCAILFLSPYTREATTLTDMVRDVSGRRKKRRLGFGFQLPKNGVAISENDTVDHTWEGLRTLDFTIPKVAKWFPGGDSTVSIQKCQPGTRMAFKMFSMGDMEISWYQDRYLPSNGSTSDSVNWPSGLYVVPCRQNAVESHVPSKPAERGNWHLGWKGVLPNEPSTPISVEGWHEANN